MNLFCYSLAFDRADLNVREHFALDAHERGQLRRMFIAAGAKEALTLCTCNRTEIYYVLPTGQTPPPAAEFDLPAAGVQASKGAPAPSADASGKTVPTRKNSEPRPVADFAILLLAEFKERQAAEIRNAGVLYQKEEVAEHLFALACGLRSLIIGETEILGQLKAAYADAVAADTTGKLLNRTFQRAFSLAKQIRTGTALGRFRVSVASVAVDYIRHLQGNADFSRSAYLVWGTGTVGAALVRALEEAGATPGTIISRRPTETGKLFPRWSIRNSDDLPALIAGCDVLICATGAPHILIHPQHLQQRRQRLVMADLSVPRNIAAACGALPGTRLFTVDDLAGAQGISAADGEQAALSDRLHEESLRFWRCALAGNQERCIARWRQDAHHWLDEEFTALDRDWPDLPPGLRERYRKFARSLMHRMLHLPSNALKQAIRDDLPCADYFTDEPPAPE